MLYLQHLLRAILSFSIRPALSVVRWVSLSTGSFKNRTCITGISIRSILNDKRARAKGAIEPQTCVAVVGLSNGSESWMGLSSCLSRRCIYMCVCIIYAHFCYSAEVQFRKSQKHTAPPDHTRGFPLAKFIKSKVGEPRLQILFVVIFCYGANIRKLQAAPKLTSFSLHLQICLLSTATVRHETLLNCSIGCDSLLAVLLSKTHLPSVALWHTKVHHIVAKNEEIPYPVLFTIWNDVRHLQCQVPDKLQLYTPYTPGNENVKQHSSGKSLCLIGKSTIDGHFQMQTLRLSESISSFTQSDSVSFVTNLG